MKPKRGKGFLEESSGNLSLMRLMSAISLIAATVFAFMIIETKDPTRVEFYLVLAFLVGAFTPKVFQKYAEEVVTPVEPNNKSE